MKEYKNMYCATINTYVTYFRRITLSDAYSSIPVVRGCYEDCERPGLI